MEYILFQIHCYALVVSETLFFQHHHNTNNNLKIALNLHQWIKSTHAFSFCHTYLIYELVCVVSKWFLCCFNSISIFRFSTNHHRYISISVNIILHAPNQAITKNKHQLHEMFNGDYFSTLDLVFAVFQLNFSSSGFCVICVIIMIYLLWKRTLLIDHTLNFVGWTIYAYIYNRFSSLYLYFLYLFRCVKTVCPKFWWFLFSVYFGPF